MSLKTGRSTKRLFCDFFTLDVFAILQGQRRLFRKCLGGAKTFVFQIKFTTHAASRLWSSLASKNFRSNVLSMNASSIKCWRLDHRTKKWCQEKGNTVSLLGFLSQQFRCSCKFTLALLIIPYYSPTSG